MTVFEKIQDLLQRSGIEFKVTSHRPVYTSAEAAQVRGVSLSSGAKALIVKAKDEFLMFVLPGDRRLDSKKIKRNLRYKSFRFATPEEVEELTTLQTGSIPPFGSLLGIKTFCDRALGKNEMINFNAGTHTESVEMAYQDYIEVEKPMLIDLSKT